MVEIDLKIDGKSAIEYESHSAPNVGEYISITHEDANGIFKVVKVTHRVAQLKRKDRLIHYLEVDAVTVKDEQNDQPEDSMELDQLEKDDEI